ncbi:MAG: Ni/Fe hydrogenase subunit alpha [bacterium]
MEQKININLQQVTRVEGHGSIVVNAAHGRLERCEWQVSESPRFFESMVRGRPFSEIARITSRICGICSVGHQLASIKATESAFGLKVSEQTIKLRKLLKHAENFDSHLLHIYFLVAPDLMGVPSVLPLSASHPEIVKRALHVKEAASQWSGLIGGRSTHPIRLLPGGFSKLPAEAELRNLQEILLGLIPDMVATVQTLTSVIDRIPRFERKTEFIGLVEAEEYGLYDGKVGSLMPDGERTLINLDQYRSVTNEWVSPLSTAKYTRHNLESYMVGALARINLNFRQLHPEAQKVAEILNFQVPCCNPYMNTVAQFIEAVHSLHTGIELISSLLDKGLRDEPPVSVQPKKGRGVSAVDVPRGILFHDYEYDAEGICLSANCIIPTNQNHANIQADMDTLVPEMLEAGRSQQEMELRLEMLVRSYDPCISCSTHYLDVVFKKEHEAKHINPC